MASLLALLLVARAEARHRAGALVGLVLIVALVGVAVMGSLAGARRTASALDRFRDATDARDGSSFVYALGLPVGDDLVEAIAAVDGVTEVAGFDIYTTDARFDIDVAVLAPRDGTMFRTIDRPLLLDGRLPDPAAPDEVVVSELAVELLGLRVGDRFQAGTFSPEDCVALGGDDFPGFNGPRFDLEVVGEVRVLEELQAGDTAANPVLVASPAFGAAQAADACVVGAVAAARYAPEDPPSTEAMVDATRAVAPEAIDIGAGSVEEEFVAGLQSAVDVALTALLVFTLVAAVAGLLVLTQAAVRQVAAGADVGRALEAIGLTRSEMALASSLPLATAALFGVVVAALGSVALSPLFPIGAARRAEPDPGLAPDPLVLLVGATVLVLVVVATAFFAARRGLAPARPATRSRLTAAVLRQGAAPTVVVGVGLADDRTRSRSAVGAAVFGVGLAIAGVAAVAIISGSLTRTLDRPVDFGWAWSARPDVDSEDPEATVNAIAEDDRLTAVAALQAATLEIEGESAQGYALEPFKGAIDFAVIDGRPPVGPGEVALGADLLTDVDVGDMVAATTTEGEVAELQVVGRMVLPHLDSAATTSLLVVPDGLALLTADQERSLLLTYRDGVDVERLEADLEADHGLSFPTYARPTPPGRLLHLDEIRGLLVVVAGFFALLGIAGLAHALAVSTRRNRGTFATLRSLGFLRRQVMGSVGVCSLAIVGVAALVGVPVGIVLGRLAWRAAVGGLGIIDTPFVPGGAVVLLAATAAVVGVVIAGPLAWRAARGCPAELLRAE